MSDVNNITNVNDMFDEYGNCKGQPCNLCEGACGESRFGCPLYQGYLGNEDLSEKLSTVGWLIGLAQSRAMWEESCAEKYKACKDYGNPKSTLTSGYNRCIMRAGELRILESTLKDYKALLVRQATEKSE